MPAPRNATPRHVPSLSLDQNARPSYEASRPASDIIATTERRPRSQDDAAQGESATPAQSRKKKAGNMFGFLTLKEPSTSAWKEFADQQKTLAVQKTGKPLANGLPGMSTQKLPNHVPRVNSKWNGLPEHESFGIWQHSQNQRNNRMSTLSASSRSSHSAEFLSKKPIGSLSSKPSSSRRSRDTDHTKQASSQIIEVQEEPLVTPSIFYNASPPAATHPALRSPVRNSFGPESDHRQTFLDPPSPTTVFRPCSGRISSPERELSDVPYLQSYDTSSSSVSSSRQNSPPTPSWDELPPPPVPERHAKHNLSHALEKGTFWVNSDSEDVVVQSAGHDVLPPPTTITREPSMRSAFLKPHPEDTPCTVDEVKDDASTETLQKIELTPEAAPDKQPDLIRNFSHPSKYHVRTNSMSSRYSRTSSMTVAAKEAFSSPALPATLSSTPVGVAQPTPADTHTIVEQEEPSESARPISVASSSASSIVSAQWKMSPKERLSLGAKVTKENVLPWEMYDPPRPISLTGARTPGGDAAVESKRLKRISQRLGLK